MPYCRSLNGTGNDLIRCTPQATPLYLSESFPCICLIPIDQICEIRLQVKDQKLFDCKIEILISSDLQKM